MNKLTLLTLIFAGVLATSFFVEKSMSGNYIVGTEKVTEELVNDSTNSTVLNVENIKDITGKAEYQLIDLRPKAEFEKSHLENAINVPIGEIVKTQSFEDFDNDKQKVLYANDYALASNTAFYLMQIGIKNIKYLRANFKDAQNYINGSLECARNCDQEKPKYDFNKYFNQPVKKTAPKMVVPAAKKVRRASGGC